MTDTYSYIGSVYSDQGNLDQALEMYMKCLNIRKAHYSENNIKLVNIYNNIGIVYQQKGKLDQALEMYVKCINI